MQREEVMTPKLSQIFEVLKNERGEIHLDYGQSSNLIDWLKATERRLEDLESHMAQFAARVESFKESLEEE
jgi:hypothetical protein